jgi:hypothetical protein
MTWGHRVFSTAELRAEGLTRARIGTAIRLGYLIRTRRGFYVHADTPDIIVRALRVGGRLTCLSLLSLMGIFVLRNEKVHVHLPRSASRMRSPHSQKVRLESRRTRGVRLHWLPLIDPVPRGATCVEVVDALAHAVLCQAPRAAIATLDSALHLGHVTEARLADVFRALPAKYAPLRALVGDVELQVEFEGIGRVDIVVDGWLVIECDSKEFHETWEQQVKDRNRDLALAARGYVTLRLTAGQIMYRDEEVLAAVKGLLAMR